MAACAKTIKRENRRKSEDSKKWSTETNDNGWSRRQEVKNDCVVENIEPQKKLRECDEIKENEKKCSPMSKTRPKQGSDEWGNLSNVPKTIVKQSIEVSLGYFANGPMGFSSPMSKTRSKQGQDCSNVSKTIEKQGI